MPFGYCCCLRGRNPAHCLVGTHGFLLHIATVVSTVCLIYNLLRYEAHVFEHEFATVVEMLEAGRDCLTNESAMNESFPKALSLLQHAHIARPFFASSNFMINTVGVSAIAGWKASLLFAGVMWKVAISWGNFYFARGWTQLHLPSVPEVWNPHIAWGPPFPDAAFEVRRYVEAIPYMIGTLIAIYVGFWLSSHAKEVSGKHWHKRVGLRSKMTFLHTIVVLSVVAGFLSRSRWHILPRSFYNGVRTDFGKSVETAGAWFGGVYILPVTVAIWLLQFCGKPLVKEDADFAQPIVGPPVAGYGAA